MYGKRLLSPTNYWEEVPDACAVGVGVENWGCAGIWCVGGGLSVWGKKYGALLGAGFVYGGKMCVCAGGEGFFMHGKRLLYSIDLLGGGARCLCR